jgi:acyl carrier protein
MVMSELLKIINTVRAHQEFPPLVVLRREMKLRDDLGFDSLDLAELTVRVEDAFGVDVFADGLVFTVGEVEQRIRDGGGVQKSKGLNVGWAEPSPADAGSKGLNV